MLFGLTELCWPYSSMNIIEPFGLVFFYSEKILWNESASMLYLVLICLSICTWLRFIWVPDLTLFVLVLINLFFTLALFWHLAALEVGPALPFSLSLVPSWDAISALNIIDVKSRGFCAKYLPSFYWFLSILLLPFVLLSCCRHVLLLSCSINLGSSN